MEKIEDDRKIMEDVKFRAWNKNTKEYLDYGTFYFLDLLFREPKLMEEIYTNGMPNELLVFEQYTGMKDKNKKEIYNGDLVRIGKNYPGLENGLVVKVILNRGCFCLDTGTITTDLIGEMVEVVGNSFQNPELLNNKKIIMKNKKQYDYSKSQTEFEIYRIVSFYGLTWVVFNAIKSKVGQIIKRIKKLIAE